MNHIIEELNELLNPIVDIESIRNDLVEFKENLIEALEALDPVNGLDDIMEDIDLIIQKINGEMEW